MMLQKLWLEMITWDQNVSDTLTAEWEQIKKDFIHFTDIHVDRWLRTINNTNIQIHGFSGASIRAYAAVVYIRTETSGKVETKLIAANTRVAPLKTISFSRLELCGALLLSKLMKQIGTAMKILSSHVYDRFLRRDRMAVGRHK